MSEPKITQPSTFATRAAERGGSAPPRRRSLKLNEAAVEAQNPEVPILIGKPYTQRKAEREARRNSVEPTPLAVRETVTVAGPGRRTRAVEGTP